MQIVTMIKKTIWQRSKLNNSRLSKMDGLAYCLCAKTAIVLLACLIVSSCVADGSPESNNKPEVLVAIMGQNQHCHLLPYLLGFVENLKTSKSAAVWLSTSPASPAENWFYSVQHTFHAYSAITQDASYESALRYAQTHAIRSILFLTPACLLYSNSSVVQDLLDVLNLHDGITMPKLGSFPASLRYNNKTCNCAEGGRCQRLSGDDSSLPTGHMCFLVGSEKAIRLLRDEERVAGTARNNLSVRLIENVNGSYGVYLPFHDDDVGDAQRQSDLDKITNLLTLLYASEKYDVLSPTPLWPRMLQDDQRFRTIKRFLDRVVVLNLDRRPDRLKLMKSNLDALGKTNHRVSQKNTTRAILKPSGG